MLGNLSENVTVVNENIGDPITVNTLINFDINNNVEDSRSQLIKKKEADMKDINLFIKSVYYENHYLLKDESSAEAISRMTKRKASAEMRGRSSDLLYFVVMRKSLKKNSDIEGLGIDGRRVVLETSAIPEVPSISKALVIMRRIKARGEIKELQDYFSNNKMALDIGEKDDILIFPECLSDKAQLAWNSIYKQNEIECSEKEKEAAANSSKDEDEEYEDNYQAEMPVVENTFEEFEEDIPEEVRAALDTLE